MAVPTIRLSPRQVDDIVAICDLGPEALSRVIDAVRARPLTIKSAALRETIAAEIGEELAEVMERFALGLATAQRRGIITSSNLLDSIDKSLASEFGVDSQKLKKWNEIRAFIEQIFGLKSVELAAKALDLSYDFEHLFIASRILTDIRPIFNDKRSEIVGMTITQTLRIEYTSSGSDQNNISIAMDVSDVKQLEKVCGEALRKADVSRQLVEQKYGLEAMMAEEDSG